MGDIRDGLAIAAWLDAALIFGALLILVGGLVGLALGWVGAVGISGLIEARTGLAFALKPEWSDGLLVLGLVALGSLFATLPALAAFCTPVDSALRS